MKKESNTTEQSNSTSLSPTDAMDATDATDAMDATENTIPATRPQRVVGIGASAGGLDALERFFKRMPLDTEMAFVIVQHLAPDFNSLMDELLARHTKLPIYEVTDGVTVAPNTVYLLPPRANMIYMNGQLRLSERDSTDVFNLPIDIFLRSLAQDVETEAIGVILSGTGSDGSKGIVALREAGGVVAVQEPASALFDGMPRNAIDTRTAHVVASAEELPHKILAHIAQPMASSQAFGEEQLRHEQPHILAVDALPEDSLLHLEEENELSIILALLRTHFQIDFVQYKPETILRRIQRRINITRVASAAAYLALLQSTPAELDALYRDLLIDVTQFFRDEQAFDNLKSEIEKMVKSASLDDGIRVWIAACATGEEAYSVAMLFAEALSNHAHPVRVQIFATDAHPESLATASRGHYSAQRVENIPASLAEKYLVKLTEDDEGDYAVTDVIRQTVVFAQHNLLQDPPFTRLSLVCCRNMLIYMKPHAQERILSQFFFGLKTTGILFLGPSEQLGRLANDFQTLDQHWRIFSKQSGASAATLLNLPDRTRLTTRTGLGQPRPEQTSKLALYETLIDSQMPASLLLNEHYELVRTFGNAGKYLRIAGDASYHILDLVDLELSTALRAGLHRARQSNQPVAYTGVRIPLRAYRQDTAPPVVVEKAVADASNEVVDDDADAQNATHTQPAQHQIERAATEVEVPDQLNLASEEQSVRLRVTVTPISERKLDMQYFLVKLEETDEIGARNLPGEHRAASALADEAAVGDDPSLDVNTPTHRGQQTEATTEYIYREIDEASRQQITLVEEELVHAKEYLQSTIEELETTNEEMQSTNEELIASNEELQSTNEELHSVNEELYTVNSEYQRKIDELQTLTNDMTNLQNSTQIATIFLDQDLRIRHFTPNAAEIFRLLPQDINRPIEHLRPDIDLEQHIFIDYLQSVARDHIPIEIEVAHKSSDYFLLRILPYHTHDGTADGVVLTLVNVTSLKQVEETLVEQQKLIDHLAKASPAYFYLFDVQEGHLIYANREIRAELGYTAEEIAQMPSSVMQSVSHPDDYKTAQRERVRLLNKQGSTFHGEVRLLHKDGSLRWYLRRETVYALDTDGQVKTVLGAALDTTDQKNIEAELVESNKLIAKINEVSPACIYLWDEDDQHYVYRNRILYKDLGYGDDEIEHMDASELKEIGHPDDIALLPEMYQKLSSVPRGEVFQHEVRLRHKNGEWHWFLWYATVNERHKNNEMKSMVGFTIDITARKKVEAALKASEQKYAAIVENQTELITRYNYETLALTFVNPAYCNYFGLSEKDVIGHSFLSLIPDEQHEEVLAHIQQLSTEGEPYVYRHQVIAADGTIRWQEWTDYIISNKNGIPTEVQATGRDVTEQYELAINLQESEAHYRSLIENTIDAIYMFDMSANIVDVNPQACQELGYTHEELTSLTVADIIPKYDNTTFTSLVANLEIGGQLERERFYVRKDGSRFPIESRSVKIERNGEAYLLSTARNISARKEAEETIVSLHKQLAEANHLLETERDQVIYSLMESEERYRAHIEATTAVLWASDPQGHFISPQSSWADYTGQLWPAHKKNQWLEMFHAEDRATIEAAFRAGIEKRELFTLNARLWSADLNRYAHVQLRAVPIQDESDLREWVGSIVDVDMGHIAHQAVQMREDRMRLLYEITSHIATDVEIQLAEALRLAAEVLNSQYAAIGRIDDDTYVVRHLYASGTNMEIGQELPLPETYCSIILEQDDVLVIDHMAQSGYADRLCYSRMGYESYIGTTIKVDGKPYGNVCFFGENPKSPPYANADMDFVRLLAGWIGFAIERLRIDRAHALQSVSLEAMNAELARSNQDLDTFVYIASHDLKEPLRGINQYAQFLQEDYGDKVDDEGQFMLSSLRDQSSRAEKLIEDLRFYSRIGRTNLGLEEINVTELINDILQQIQARLSKQKIVINVADDLPDVVYNYARLSTVFQNLLVNAIKYNDKEEKRLDIGILYADAPPEPNIDFNRSDLPTEDLGEDNFDLLAQLSYGIDEVDSPTKMPWLPEGTLIFFVRDNGIGIEERNIARIFGMFKRLHGHNEYGGGTGAGLPIVRRILERSSGRIWVESTPQEGTVFKFTLGLGEPQTSEQEN